MLLSCEFGDMRIWSGCQSSLTGAEVNPCRALPEVPQTLHFVRSSCGWLFKLGTPSLVLEPLIQGIRGP